MLDGGACLDGRARAGGNGLQIPGCRFRMTRRMMFRARTLSVRIECVQYATNKGRLCL